MDFTIPAHLTEEATRFDRFLDAHLKPQLSAWNRAGAIPAAFYRAMGTGGWFGLNFLNRGLESGSAILFEDDSTESLTEGLGRLCAAFETGKPFRDLKGRLPEFVVSAKEIARRCVQLMEEIG